MANKFWPVEGSNGSNIYGTEDWHKWQSGEGIYALDISTSNFSPGHNLIAVADGTLYHFASGTGPLARCKGWASNNAFGPNAFYIVSTDGQTVFGYGHGYSVSVGDGQTVNAGDVVGVEGNLGHVIAGPGGDGTHVHFWVDTLANTQCGGSTQARATSNFLKDASLPAITTTSSKFPGNGASIGTQNIDSNLLASDLISIVPDKIVFVIDGKADPDNWISANSLHNRNFGLVSGVVGMPVKGHLDRIIYVNAHDAVLDYEEVNQDMKEGDQIAFKYNYSIQSFLDCSTVATELLSSPMLHDMTVLTNGWEDGHTYATNDDYSTKSYEKEKDGEEITTPSVRIDHLRSLLTGVNILSKK